MNMRVSLSIAQKMDGLSIGPGGTTFLFLFSWGLNLGVDDERRRLLV